MNKFALSIKNLQFKFQKSGQPFFNDLSITLEKGHMHHLHGCNGSGKSTLFNIIKGTYKNHPHISGTILLHNNEEYSSHDIAMVHQKYDSMLANHFSFEENLQFSQLGKYPGLQSIDRIKVDIPKLVDRFGIDITKPVSMLSGGQRQILSLLMILQKQPKLLLLDEPTAALDPMNAKIVFEFLKAITDEQDITLLIVTHDHVLADEYCNGKKLQIQVMECGTRGVKVV